MTHFLSSHSAPSDLRGYSTVVCILDVPRFGGAELATLLLVKHGIRFLEDKGIAVIIFCDNNILSKAISILRNELNRYDNLKVVGLSMKIARLNPYAFIKSIIRKYLPKAVWLPRYFIKYAFVFKSIKPESKILAHVHDNIIVCPIATAYNVLHHNICSPLLRSVRECAKCIYSTERLNTKPLSYSIMSALINSLFTPKFLAVNSTVIDVLIVASKSHASYICTFWPNLCKKTYTLYNPLPSDINAREYFEMSDEPSLVYVGGDYLIKGVPLIKWLLKELVKNKRRVTIYTNAQSIPRLFNSFRNTPLKIVSLRERLDRTSVLSLIRSSWIVLDPFMGYANTASYVSLEAALSGTNIVIPDVGEYKEIFGDFGCSKMIMYRHNDPIDFTDKVLQLLNLGKDGLFGLGAKLRRYILKKYPSNDVIGLKFSKIVEKVLEKNV